MIPASAAAAAAFQVSQELGQKSLPYWLFWFLMSTILLLLAVIFLRDKNLRRRMSLFFSGAKRKMLRLRLQAKLKKAREKRVAYVRELGMKAWSQNIRPAAAQAELEKLAGLEDERHVQQRTWHEVYSRIESMGRRHEEDVRRRQDLLRELEDLRNSAEGLLRSLVERKAATTPSPAAAEGETDLARLRTEQADLEADIAAAEARVAEHNARIRRVEEEGREADRGHAKSLAGWLKNKQRVQDRIVEIRRLMEPLFERLGRALDADRVAQDELDVLYFQIDNVDRTIEDLLARIQHLS